MAIDRDKNVLAWTADHAGADPFFMAHALRAYREMFDLDEEGLAKFLHCSSEALVRMALCRQPEMTSTTFRADVEQIAAYCGADAQRVAELVRQTDAVRSLRGVPAPVPMSTPAGMMVAARDRGPRKGRPRKKRSEK